MITVQDYRKRVKTRKRRFRNWVFVAIILILSILFVDILVNLFTLKEQKNLVTVENVTYQDNEIVVNITDLDLDKESFYNITRRISKLHKTTKSTNTKVKIFLNSKLVAYYSLDSPEISILNAKGQNNLAMETSLKLIQNGFNVKNYGNYFQKVEKSFIMNRTPNHELVKKLSEYLKITNISNTIFDKSIEDNLSGIIIILGRDYNL
ncbi:MAG: LytR C-terminal domain-containing protein [Brevinematia bacterium]